MTLLAPSFIAPNGWCPPEITLYAAGACRPRPPNGLACWAWSACDAVHREIAYDYGCLGQRPRLTNEVAGYVAAGKALRWAADQQLRGVYLYVGSKPVVHHVAGHWHCDDPTLRPLLARLRELVDTTGATLEWLPHERNLRAAALTHAAYWEARHV
ncbi:MAG TPA: reverse transcriptase-like protein [Ardenticatenaceae bacterium]|jgi:ribonuclease HI